MKATCPYCQAEFSIKRKYASKSVACFVCEKRFIAPAAITLEKLLITTISLSLLAAFIITSLLYQRAQIKGKGLWLSKQRWRSKKNPLVTQKESYYDETLTLKEFASIYNPSIEAKEKSTGNKKAEHAGKLSDLAREKSSDIHRNASGKPGAGQKSKIGDWAHKIVGGTYSSEESSRTVKPRHVGAMVKWSGMVTHIGLTETGQTLYVKFTNKASSEKSVVVYFQDSQAESVLKLNRGDPVIYLGMINLSTLGENEFSLYNGIIYSSPTK